MLDVDKARVDKGMCNETVTPVILALGPGIGDDFDITEVRYRWIVFTTGCQC
jgi:Type IIA topoisomerase (DNA gyrase/topo II, topoisomerase IV), B subunit